MAQTAAQRAWYQRNRQRQITATRAWAVAHPERQAELARRSMLKTRYGLTPTDYAEMMRLQCGVCAVCGAPERWLHVDHDHQTGQVRALLCGNCNRALGLLNEEPERIGALAAYASGIHGGGDKEEDE